ncbi:hypothetical protein NLI96_g5268 [Meripilus lineatus]|uniref:AB hydrolase-1 domain-containing protein n=1 Tax=Meripilus lineatus TaxID=2056292 RepID=A0AAD5YE26_9APHY|nr:hypothetical protein NLI96_g5268 [Physisporinus lineatus]
MDSSLFKDVTTTRGLKYHYYSSPAVDEKPTLLFLHGFPSTSYDWRHQVPFFKEKGYGLIVPDLLGYGGTDKPSDPASYKYSLMTADIVDILDAEKVDKVIPIGHDWGSFLTSRLASYYPERFVAYGFLALAYTPPSPDFNIHGMLAFTKQAVGYELFGYWLFFAEDGSEKIVADHVDSTLSILYPSNPAIWVTDLAPTGALKAWLLADKKAPLAPYISKEDTDKFVETLKTTGLGAPVNWYKLMVSGLGAEDDKNIAKENYIVNKPVFFAGCKQDYVCLAAPAIATLGQTCPNATVAEFETDHWVQLAAPEKLNGELLKWVEGIATA